MSVAKRVQKHREALRAMGLIWVPDTRRKGFAQECRRQSRLIAGDPHEQEVMDWIETVSE
jgi:hypothetical protein